MSEDVIFDSNEWNDYLKRMDDRLKNASRLLQALANTIGFADIIDHFAKEQGPDGGWQPRKDETNRAYDRMGGSYRSSNKILQLMGQLRGSLMPGTGKSRIVDRYSVKLVSNVPYAHRHDQGTAGMPKREFMWLSDKAKKDIADAIIRELMGGP